MYIYTTPDPIHPANDLDGQPLAIWPSDCFGPCIQSNILQTLNVISQWQIIRQNRLHAIYTRTQVHLQWMPTIRLGILTPRAILYSLNLSISLSQSSCAYTVVFMRTHNYNLCISVAALHLCIKAKWHRSMLYRRIAMEHLVQRVERLQVYTAALVKGQKIVAAIDFSTCNTKMAFAYSPLTRGRTHELLSWTPGRTRQRPLWPPLPSSSTTRER